MKKKKVICIETGKQYNSTSEAARENFISQSAISCACNGVRQTAAGYHWEFLEKEKQENIRELN